MPVRIRLGRLGRLKTMKKNVFILLLAGLFLCSAIVNLSAETTQNNPAASWLLLGKLIIPHNGDHVTFGPLSAGTYKVEALGGAINDTKGYPYWTWNSSAPTEYDHINVNGQCWPYEGLFSTQAAAEAYWKGTHIFIDIGEGGYIDAYYCEDSHHNNEGSCTIGIYTYIEGSDPTDELGSSKKDKERDKAKDPINITNGNLYSTHQDISIPVRGLPLEFSRTYNSRDNSERISGYGWTHNYNVFINYPEGYVEIKNGEGARHFYIRNEDGTYSSPAGEYSVLVKNADDTYTFTKKHGIKYNFNSSGRLTNVIDRNDSTQTLTYTGDLLTQITDSSGKSLTLSYNADNRISEVSDPAGRAVAYDYDANGNLTSVTDPDENITTYSYDENHNLITIADPEGYSSHFTHDTENDRCESFSYDNDINKVTLSYDPENMKTTVTDSKGSASIYEYNSYGVVTKIADSEGNKRSWTWDENINRTSSTDANGNTTYFEYDERGNLTKIKDSKSNETVFTYETDFDMCTSITDALSQATTYAYDERGNLIQVENANGDKTTYAYDSSGNLFSTKDANDHTTQYEYDSYGNLIKVIDPLSNQTQFEYDILGNCAKLTDTKGHETKCAYDILNRLTQITYPDNSIVKYEYDKVGNRTKVTNQLNRITNYEYDPANKLLDVIDALQNKTIYTYDTEGNMVSLEDAKGNATTYEYDNLNRLVKSITSSGKETTYIYDSAGNRVSMTDAKANTTIYEYDENNRLVKTGIIEDIQNAKTWDTQEDFETGMGEHIDTETIHGSVCLGLEERHPVSFNGDAQLDTAQKEFGTGSALLDGTGDYLSIPDSDDWGFDTGNFTIDFWVRWNNTDLQQVIVSQHVGQNDRWLCSKDSDGRLWMQFKIGSVYKAHYTTVDVPTLNADTWYHLAFVRNGATGLIFIDGVSQPLTEVVAFGANNVGNLNAILRIGSYFEDLFFNGWLDEFRISKGIARWTSNFTPPVEPYETDQYTKLLLHVDGEDGATSTEDSSAKYSLSGSLILDYDASSTETFGDLDITATEQESTDIRARIKTADTVEGLDNANWSRWYTNFPADFMKTGRYARVEVFLGTQDYLVTPVLESISLSKINLSSPVAFAYDELGRRTSMTDTLGTTTYEYDNLNRVVSVGTGLAPIRYTYDKVGNRTSMIDQNEGLTQYQYDELNRLVSLTSPDGKVTSYSYDSISNLTNMSLPNNTQVNYQFDNLNRLLNLTNKKNTGDAISSFGYDYNLSGMRNKVMLADGSYIEYEYDDLNRLTKEAKYDMQGNVLYSNTYEFDSVGNRLKLTKLIPGDLEEKTFEDDFNRKKLWENWEIVNGKWKICGRRWLFGWAKNNGEVLYNSEDNIGNFEAEVDLNRIYLRYKRAQLSGISYQRAEGRRIAGVKGELKRYLEKKKVKRTIIIWKWKKVKIWRWYRWVRYPVRKTYWRWKYHWRIERQINYVLGHYEGSILVEDAVFTEKTKRRVFSKKIKVKVEDGKTELFAKENGNWIKKIEFAYPATEEGRVGLFVHGKRVAYSRFDNFKLAYQVGTPPQEKIINYAYNEENQLLNANDAIYDYDDNGNLVRKDDVQGATDYSWDYENRLIGIDYPDGSSDSYTYDGVGKRIQASEDGNVTNYLYDGLNVIIEQDGSGMTTASYVRGLGYGGGIGSIISANNNYYYYDGIGNVVNIADNSGSVTQSFIYDAYGNILNGAVPSPHGFSTKEYSNRSGLIHFGARSYDPMVGRWISKDTYTWGPDDPRILGNQANLGKLLRNRVFLQRGMINSEMPLDTLALALNDLREYTILQSRAMIPQLLHRYMYCFNNPVNYIDPWGLCKSPLEKFADFLKWFSKLVDKVPTPGPTSIAKKPLVKILELAGATAKAGASVMEGHTSDINEMIDTIGED